MTGENVGAKILRHELKQIMKNGRCVDDISGEELNEDEVKAARALEMDYFQKMGVYTYVSRKDAAKSGVGKVISGRWIDVNKGDSTNHDYRSSFVGK